MQKRWKRQISVVLMTVFLLSLLAGPAVAYDTDVTPDYFYDLENHWALEPMSQLIEMGIVNGYEKEVTEDGETYYEYYAKPDQLISRAEFATMLAKALNLTKSAIGSKFNDVSGHWAEGYIYDLYNRGIINGYSDGTFKPEAKIRRSEIVTMLTKALNNQNPVTEAVTFTDVKSKTDHWSYDFIRKAVAMDIIKGYTDGSFKPEGRAKRGEVMTMLVNFLNNDLTAGPADEEILAVADNYQKKVDEIINSTPDLKNEENPYDWSPAYQYVTGAEKLSLDELSQGINGLALLGVDFSIKLLELGQGQVISKSDRTAVVKQYVKVHMKIGPNEETVDGEQLIKLMKEDGKWLIYANPGPEQAETQL